MGTKSFVQSHSTGETFFGVNGHFLPERYRQATTFNGENDSYHRQLYESAIRLETSFFLQKLGGFRSNNHTDQTYQVSMCSCASIHVAFSKIKYFPTLVADSNN